MKNSIKVLLILILITVFFKEEIIIGKAKLYISISKKRFKQKTDGLDYVKFGLEHVNKINSDRVYQINADLRKKASLKYKISSKLKKDTQDVTFSNDLR